jgi:hypothetical protein
MRRLTVTPNEESNEEPCSCGKYLVSMQKGSQGEKNGEEDCSAQIRIVAKELVVIIVIRHECWRDRLMGEFLGLLPGEWACCLERCLDPYEHRGTAGYL